MAHHGARTFSYRSGVRVRGTVLACDATAGSDLIFLSHALALDAHAARMLRRPRAGRRHILTTETTLALLGRAGARLRPHALAPAYGRPFALGGMRLELFPSGHLPGAASLLCEVDGRRIVYAGPVGVGPRPAELRRAGVLCVDGRFGQPRFQFPPYQQALDDLREHVRAAASAGRAPGVLARPPGAALDVAAQLVSAGLTVRAQRPIIAAAAAYKAAGLPVPPLARFAGRLGAGEALVWTPEHRQAGQLRALPNAFILLASPSAVDRDIVDALRVDAAVPLSAVAGFVDLLAFIDATGATEVAIRRATDGQLVQTLAGRGIDAYLVGPPQQIALFG
ncbi:MAG TPA: hypothetical protein VMU50_14380 [Polyangia bacterium]|nr:hypothetical protein [Polyangia bacterium]